jgi:RimJ/RimL family protein N-acetyltransferase
MRGPAIETDRLILRPPRAEDLDGWAELMGDAEAARFIGGV